MAAPQYPHFCFVACSHPCEQHNENAGNPCGKAGSGAIPDSTDAAQKAKLQSIADAAEPGLTTTDLAAAQKAAQSTADAISP